MAVYFFDSSALVKRYVQEAGSQWVGSVVDPAAGNDLHICSLTGVEVVAAVVRRQRGGTISAVDAATVCNDFRHDFANHYRVVQITANLIAAAMSLAERHALRGYDAVQLAAALEVDSRCRALGIGSLTVVSADAELNAAAAAERLTVADPAAHR